MQFEGLDADQLQKKLVDLANTAQGISKAGETVSKVYDSVRGFFSSVGSFFTDLFGGSK